MEFQNFSGIRKHPSYEKLAEWVSESLLKIQAESIKHSFAICGLYKGEANKQGLSFISNLNSRLKSILLVNKNTTIFEQFIDLASDV